MQLGLSREEFFLLQARQLGALVRQNRHRDELQDLLLSRLTAAVMNFSLGAPDPPKKTEDLLLFPSSKAVTTRYRSRAQVADNIGQIMRGFMK